MPQNPSRGAGPASALQQLARLQLTCSLHWPLAAFISASSQRQWARVMTLLLQVLSHLHVSAPALKQGGQAGRPSEREGETDIQTERVIFARAWAGTQRDIAGCVSQWQLCIDAATSGR